MPWQVYLSGEIHTDWRERILDGAGAAGLDVVFTGPVTDHGASDDCGAAILGAKLVILNPERKCRVEDIPMHQIVAQMDTLINDVRPDLVITHSAHDMHWDHSLVNRATVSALRRWPCNLLAYVSSYEMNAQNSTRTVGQCFADITETIERKVEAIAAHETQLRKMDLDSTRDVARAMGRLAGVQYAEAYEVLRLRF